MACVGGIEAGGTKIICAIADETGHILDRIRVPTISPEVTMSELVAFFKQYPDIQALGVGAFGPVDPDEQSQTYGYITDTPKVKWRNYNFLGELQTHINVPAGFDTDVNVAALGEYTWGAAQEVSDFLYITVGTGIGVGHIVNHQFAHGLSHPEMGHILVNRSPQERSDFKGICPYHKNCLEGLAAGPAINARWSIEHAGALGENHAGWEIESDYLAEALMSYILICSPKKIIMGGGVMNQKQLFPMIRQKVQRLLNGYVRHPSIKDHIDQYIIPPGLGDEAGIKGAVALALRVLER